MSYIKDDQLEQQLKKLLVFKSEIDPELLLESIDKMRPLVSTVSEQRYKQLNNDIVRGFTVPQLRNYIKTRTDSGINATRWRKTEAVSYILNHIWKLESSKSIVESSDVIVENVISLSRRDLFLLLSKNGHIARQWTRSGAVIIILGSEQKIVVRSSKDTYQWIEISLNQYLSGVESKTLDFSAFGDMIDFKTLPLERIQRVSDAYIETNGSKMVLYGLGHTPIRQAERLVWAASGYNPRTTESLLIDSSQKNNERGVYSTIIDEESLHWLNRGEEWARWKLPKTKQQKTESIPETSSFDLNNLFSEIEKENTIQSFLETKSQKPSLPETPDFKLLPTSPNLGPLVELPVQAASTSELFEKAITDSIFKTYNTTKTETLSVDESAPTNVTLVATYGDLLQPIPKKDEPRQGFFERSSQGKKTVASAFLANIPNIVDHCRQLPLFFQPEADEAGALEDGDADEHLDFLGLEDMKPGENVDRDISITSSPDKYFANNQSPAQVIDKLFGSDKPVDIPEETVSDNHTYYVQLKFLPSPFFVDGTPSLEKPAKDVGFLQREDGTQSPVATKRQFENLPSVEMWLVVDENEVASKDTATLVSVEKENTIYVPMPHMNSDIKFSSSKSQFLLDREPVSEDSEATLSSIINKRRLESVDNYLNHAVLNFSGAVKVSAPNILMLEMPVKDDFGKVSSINVPYIYQTMAYRKQIDLKFENHILQLATIEGGVIGGRRIEANLVLDKPAEEMQGLESSTAADKDRDTCYESIKSFVKSSLSFLDSIQSPLDTVGKPN